MPETISDPKSTITQALKAAFQDDPRRKRRRRPSIGSLYLPIGQKISLGKLESLESYRKFKEAVRQAYRQLNYL